MAEQPTRRERSEEPDRVEPWIKTDALSLSIAHFARPPGADLLARTRGLHTWLNARRRVNTWTYSRSLDQPPAAVTRIRSDTGEAAEGINFASQDYLSLSAHPDVHRAAERAIRDFGPHSAGSPNLLGNTSVSLELEREIGETLGYEVVMLFPTGWAAGFGSIVGLVRPHDHIVMDRLSHACLQQGAHAATGRVRRHAHLAVDEARQLLREIRSEDTDNGILVVTEGLFSMDSDVPDLGALQEACREFGATLLVDVAHDFGAMGPGGTGQIGAQGLLGQVDLVMGSFSKSFASNGGFLATHDPAVKDYVKLFGGSHVFSNALSPVQAAVVREALRIIRSEEGDALRGDLLTAVNALRAAFAKRGIECIGEPSAIVPVPIGSEKVARLASGLTARRGVLVNLVEYPAVATGAARFRMQVMAGHSVEQAEEAARVVFEAIADAERELSV